MAVVNNSTASIIGHGAGNITLGGAGTGTSWSTGLSIQPHNVKANMIMDVFIEWVDILERNVSVLDFLKII